MEEIVDRTFGQPWARRIAGSVAAAGVGLGVLAGCGNDTAGPETGASVEDIQEDNAVEEPADPTDPADPAEDEIGIDEVPSFVGQTVTVSAEVNEIISDRAFTIAGTENTGAEPLLVIAGQPGMQVTQDSAVAVTGTVKQSFDLAAVESEYGFDYDDALFTDFDGEPYLVANSIDTTVSEPAESTN
jgi:hypothetical protein